MASQRAGPPRAALTVLTNSTSGPALTVELCYGDWALRQFAGLSNPPAVPLTLTPAELAPYVGQYLARSIDPGKPEEFWIELSAADGRLRARLIAGDVTEQELDLAFYRDNYVVVLGADGQPGPARADFVRGPDGSVAWFRFGGRLYAPQG